MNVAKYQGQAIKVGLQIHSFWDPVCDIIMIVFICFSTVGGIWSLRSDDAWPTKGSPGQTHKNYLRKPGMLVISFTTHNAKKVYDIGRNIWRTVR